LTDFFSTQDNATTGLNPYMLIFISKFIINGKKVEVLKVKNLLANFINLLLLFSISFYENKILTIKLLKMVAKLLVFAKENSAVLAKSGEMELIIKNSLIKEATKVINFEDEASSNSLKFTDSQLIFMELHLMLDRLRDYVEEKDGVYIGRILEDSQEMSLVKRNI